MTTIEYLYDYSEYAGKVARWLYDEFIHSDGSNFEYEVFAERFQANSKTQLPIRLVAISDEKCVGTVAFVGNDFRGKSYTPWLGGLYVDTPYRSHGIGRQLIDFVKQIATESGYKEIYLVTITAGKYYQSLGWHCIETCVNEAGQMCEIYKYTL